MTATLSSLMSERGNRELQLAPAIWRWFREIIAQEGLGTAIRRTCALAWEFARDSMPDRRRQRYGDVDYDWDHRVDTTAATVGWRDRLLGLLHSAYQPTDPAAFREMLDSLNIDFRQFVFIDIGSGKGRTLLMASDYPFRRALGIELLPELDRIARENIRKYKSNSQQRFKIEAVCGDALDFVFPEEPMVLYLFNPLSEQGLVQFLANLEQSLRKQPRAVFVLYHNPILQDLLLQYGWLGKIGGTHQYSVYEAKNS